MTIHRILNCILAVVVVASLLYIFAKFDEQIEQGDLRHQAGLSAELRFAKAAQKMCGSENASWELLADGSIQCRTKRGHKTLVARVEQ